jgi:serine/threonine protein kinase
MAPEQFAGKGATVRSDIYALGLVLYEIYCGRKAFDAPTIPELRAQKENHIPTAPSEIRAGIDPIVERVIMRCLERDQRARLGSSAQLAAEHLRFPLKAPEAVRVVFETGGQKLQCNITQQLRVARPKHDAHAAFAKRGRDFIWTNAVARAGSHARHSTFF